MEEAKAIRTLILAQTFSSLVRSEGITRSSLTILLHDENIKVLAPSDVVAELRKHAHEIRSKAGIARTLFEDILDRSLENIELIPSSLYEKQLHEALWLVRDENECSFRCPRVGKVTFNDHDLQQEALQFTTIIAPGRARANPSGSCSRTRLTVQSVVGPVG